MTRERLVLQGRSSPVPQHGGGQRRWSAEDPSSGQPGPAAHSLSRMSILAPGEGAPAQAGSSSAPVIQKLDPEGAALRLQRAFRRRQSNRRAQEYAHLKAAYVRALSMNSVGQALLTDPHVKHARLVSSATEPPVHTANRENPFEDTINVLPASRFPSAEEHSATYTHEALHKFHHQVAPEVFKHRKATSGTHPAWSNAEEEHVIRGHDVAFPGFPDSPLNENTARRELGLKERFSHQPVGEDLPRMMSGAEFQEYRSRQMTAPLPSVAPPSMPAALRARLEARERQRKGGGQD